MQILNLGKRTFGLPRLIAEKLVMFFSLELLRDACYMKPQENLLKFSCICDEWL